MIASSYLSTNYSGEEGTLKGKPSLPSGESKTESKDYTAHRETHYGIIFSRVGICIQKDPSGYHVNFLTRKGSKGPDDRVVSHTQQAELPLDGLWGPQRAARRAAMC